MDIKAISIIPADRNNEHHSKGVWNVFNDNIGFNVLTTEKVSFENHSKWWNRAFEDEYIYLVLFKDEICGYIRLAKRRTNSKEQNEISIAILNKYHGTGLGTHAYSLFEKEMKKKGIDSIVAITHFNNKKGRSFFEKNGFENIFIKYFKKL